jgi:ABC-2 type transport system permease protein
MSPWGPASQGVVALSARLVRRGGLILAAVGAAYVAVEVLSYEQSYPTAASRAHLAAFQDNPSVRMIQGLAHDVDTTGGFVAWDGGWFLETLAAIWVLLAILRLTRGDEETDRAALVLMTPLSARRVLGLQLLTTAAAGLVFSVACGVALLCFGVPVGGAALFTLGLAGFVATATCFGALAAQLLDVRRRAVGAASGLVAASFLVRMVGNSDDTLSWMRWLSPYGWMDNLRAFGSVGWTALGLLLSAPLALSMLCLSLRARRDTGGAVRASHDDRDPHERFLGSPLAFAFRCSRGVLIAWGLGLAAYAALIGSMLPTMVDYLAKDPDLRKSLTAYGIDVEDITTGMVGFMSLMFGLAFALFACWRLGAARSEEDSGRADLLLVRPLTRRSWLGGHLVLATGSVLLLATTTGLSMWAGGALAGASLSMGQAVGATWNTVPVVLLLMAVAVLLLGTRPRVTVVGSASLAALCYLLPAVGKALGLPVWVRDVSPFQHLAVVPVQPYAVTSGVVMLLLAAAVGSFGVVAFSQRDLSSA